MNIQYFSGTGAGGQHRNKHQNCVRMSHLESGATATGQSNKSRIANVREAFSGLTKHVKFKVWINREIQAIVSGKNIDEIVAELMKPENIKCEIKEGSRWVREQEIQ